ncbi:MAG: sigma-54 dependent transcriptional regulator [Desulfotalea sp.]
MNKRDYSLLIVDDDPSILEVLDARFCAAGFTIFKASDGASALEIFNERPIDLIVSDVKMPNMSGIELYSKIQSVKPGTPIIFLTAYGSIPEAVYAVQTGAIDYLSKPFDGKLLVQKVKDYFASDVQKVHKQTTSFDNNGFYWGESPAMKTLQDMISRIASSNVNTLVLGESGVGKECVAMTIHQNSNRKNGPLIVIDCGSTPPGILESELFGHTKGAFTNAIKDKKGLIEAADGGTLFLDEIGNISAEMQHRLLRFLEDKKIRKVGSVEEKQIDCRVIAATNTDLAADIESGKFRQDLYYRLRVVTLNLPSLRDRKEDIPALTELFVQHHCKGYGIEPIVIPSDTLEWMKKYDWPGNVRELKNSLEAGVVLCKDGQLNRADLQLEQLQQKASLDNSSNEFSLDHSEKETIVRALRKTKGVLTSAAELLDISRRSIHYKLKKYEIDASDFK